MLCERQDLSSNGAFPFSEPVLCVYADIDTLIETAPLTKDERKIVHQVMRGYGFSDIAEHYGVTRQTVHILFRHAVTKLCRENDARWERTHAVI